MNRILPINVLCVVLLASWNAVFAGGVNTSPNQSAEWCKTLNRSASTEPDAAYYNPAGTAFLGNGVYMYLGDQVIYQPVRVESARSASIGLSRKSYYGEKNSWYLLNGYLMLKYGKLALSGCGIGFGSGGKSVFNNGIQELDAQVGSPYGLGAAVNRLYANFGLGTPVGEPTAFVVSKFSGSYTIYSVQVNAAYEVMEGRLALSLGFRFYLGEATYDAKIFAPGPGAAYGGFIPLGGDLHSHRQGISEGIIAGVSAKPVGGLVLGLRAEWNAPFRLDTRTHDQAVLILMDYRFKNNRRVEDQLPANVNAGASYETKGIRISASFGYYFNQYAQMRGREKGYTGGIDAGAGLDYTFGQALLNIGAGYLWRSTGARPSAQSQLDEELDSHSVALGLTCSLTRDMQLTVAEVYTYFVPADVNRGRNTILKALPARFHTQSFNTAVGLTSKFSF